MITTRRRMLRWMVGVPRLPEETWPDFIKRATHRCEDLAHTHGAADWVVLQRTQKWRLAGKAAVSSDGRWTKRMLDWKPWFRVFPHRDVGHPFKRWDDDIVKVAGGGWPDAALDGVIWQALGEAHVAS